MTDRTAATVGFVLAGLALAASLGAWSGRFALLAAGLSALATVTLAARRHGYLDPGAADGVAAVGGIGAAMTALVSLVAGTAAVAAGAIGTAVAGVGVAALAYADWRGVSRSGLLSRFSRAATATAIGLGGLVAIFAWYVVLGVIYRSATGAIDPATDVILSTIALGLATGSVAWLYLQGTDRNLDFIDVRQPTVRDGGYIVGGTLVLVGLNLGIGTLFEALGLPAARHTLYDIAERNPQTLLVLVPLSFLLVGPGEELLYRNVVQKSLYGTFSRPAAILLASAIFAAMHLPAYSSVGSTALSIMNTLTIVFALALVLGTAYERTGNLVVCALIHGSFNAIAFVVAYVQLAG